MESESSVCVQGVVSDVGFRDVSGGGGQGMIVWEMCELDEVECGTRVNGGDSDFFFFVVLQSVFPSLCSHSPQSFTLFFSGLSVEFFGGGLCVCVCFEKENVLVCPGVDWIKR